MSIWTFGVTYTDVEGFLQGYDFDAAEQTLVAGWIDLAAANLEVHLRQQGWTSEFASDTRGYALAQDYIISSASARAQRAFTHQDSELAQSRSEGALDILQTLKNKVESTDDSWSTDNQRGSWRSNVSLTGLRPGSSASVNRLSPIGFFKPDTQF